MCGLGDADIQGHFDDTEGHFQPLLCAEDIDLYVKHDEVSILHMLDWCLGCFKDRLAKNFVQLKNVYKN